MKSKFADAPTGGSSEALSAFDPNFERFATVTADNRLKIWDAISGSLIKECFEPAHLSTNYTSLAWGSTNLQAANGEPPDNKRSKKKKAGTRVGNGVIALGTQKGLVVVWDLQRGEIHLRLGEKGDGHTARVTGVAFTNNGSYLYSCSSDLHVIQWNVESGKIVSRFQADKQPLGALALSPDNTVLATASSHIKLWDLSSKKVLKKLTGHTKPVVDMAFSPDGEYLLSSSRDRLVSLWNCGESDDASKDSKLATHVFASSGSTLGLKFNHRRTKGKKQLEFLGISEAGEVCLWKHSLQSKGSDDSKGSGKRKEKEESKKSSKVDGTIKLPEEGGKAKTRSVICASFCSKNEVVVAHSNGVSPMFEKIKYTDAESGLILPEILLTAPQQTGAASAANKASAKQEKETNEQPTQPSQEKPKAKVLGPADMRLPDPKPEKQKKPESKVKELTLQEKVEAMELATKKKNKEREQQADRYDFEASGNGSDVTPKAESLQAVLVQALHTSDRSLMESVLGVSDPAIIANTVSRLPPKYVLPFLNEVIDRFRAKPGRGMVLITWIKAILLHHTSYLMSLPNLQESLAGLYQTVDARVNSFKGFLKLSGRLDLVLSQIEQHQNQAVSVMHSQPLAVYNEESDDEEGSDEEHGEEEEANEEDEGEDEDEAEEESEDEEEDDDAGEGGSEDDDEGEEMDDDEDEIMADRKRRK